MIEARDLDYTLTLLFYIDSVTNKRSTIYDIRNKIEKIIIIKLYQFKWQKYVNAR